MTLEYDEIKKRLKDLSEQKDTQKDKRKKRALKDFRFFCLNYLPHYADGETEDCSYFRNFVYNELPNLSSTYKIIEIFAYRGGAKTTLIARAFCIYRLIKKLSRYTVHISDGAELATENLEALSLEFEENKRLKTDFNISKGWVWKTKVFIVNIDGIFSKVQAFGTSTRIRGKNFLGQRPQDIFIDDLENDINIENEDQRNKLEKWFVKSVLKLPNRNKFYNIFILGTVLHADSVLIRISKRVDVKALFFKGIHEFPKNMELWEELYSIAKEKDIQKAYLKFKQNKEAYLEGIEVDDPSWLRDKENDFPVVFSLILDYLEDSAAFNEEIQMTSNNLENATFKLEYWDYLPSDLVYYMGVDPALGKKTKGKKKGDFTAICILGFSPSLKKYYVVDGFIARIHPDDAGTRAINYAHTYYLQNIGWETVQFQTYYEETITNKAIEEGAHFPVTPLANTEARKHLRIESLAPVVNAGTLLFNKNMKSFNEQFLLFPKGHDDAPDATEMAYRVAHYKTANFKLVQLVQQQQKMKFTYLKGKYT